MGDPRGLIAAREALVAVDTNLDQVITSLDDVRVSGAAVMGQQQNLDTALNYIADLMGRNIQELRNIKSRSADIFRVLDAKLSG